MRAEAARHFGIEVRLVQRQHRGRLGLGFRPDQRGTISRHGQDRERPRRQEMFVGHAVVRAFMRHRGDDAGLRIGPADHADAHLRRAGANSRPSAATASAARDLSPSASVTRWRAGVRRQRFDAMRARSASDWAPRHGVVKRGADMAVLGDMAQRVCADLAGDRNAARRARPAVPPRRR